MTSLVVAGFFAVKSFFTSVLLAVKPINDDVFKKYGTPDNVSKILKEIEQNKIYEDKNMIMSKKYITDKRDISKLVSCDDILGAHKVIHRTNYVIDYYGVEITDKYRKIIDYTYDTSEEETVNKILGILSQVCPNAVIGYTNDELKNINNNAVKLPKEIKSQEVFKCDNCGAIVSEDVKECPNCGERFDENEIDFSYKDINELYDKAESFKDKGNTEKAQSLYTKYISETEEKMKLAKKQCYTFDNCIGFVLAVKKKLIEDDCIDIDFNTSDAYLNLAIIAFDDKDYDSAIKLLKKSLKLNPTGVALLFEMAESYKAKGDLEKYLSWTEKSYDRLYHISQLAHYYRNLGYYYIEKREWDIAKAVYLYSLKYENNPIVEHEIKYIMTKSKDKSMPKKEELTTILREKKIPTFISKENLNVIKDLYKELEENEQINSNVGKFVTKIMKENSNS